jgi:2-C-methyl-D-erythritol 4-phosphate cytidylyltransferase
LPSVPAISALASCRWPLIRKLPSSTGAERADSVLAGLQALPEAEWVLVHDAARPCLHQDDLQRLLALRETSRVGAFSLRRFAIP